jgi:hypothetical protein
VTFEGKRFMRLYFHAAIVIAAALASSACLPVTSKTPVGTTAGLKSDPALIGMWKGRSGDGNNSFYLTFFPQDDGTLKAVLLTPPDAKDKGGWLAFSVQTAALGRNQFIDAKELDDSGKAPDGKLADNTVPLLYRINGDGALVLYLPDDKAVAAAIKQGKIAGETEPGQYGDVTLTASAADLDALMATPEGRALFKKPLAIFKRVK